MSKLEALVTKLNEVGGASLTVSQLQENIAKMNPLELNEFIDGIFNKIFKSYIFNRVIFSHPILSQFVEAGTSVEAHREYFDTQLIQGEDYDLNKKFSNDIKRTKTLQTVFSTILKRVMSLTINLHQARAAFASETAFSQWLESQYRVISESINIELYDVISKRVVAEVKNTIDLKSIDKYDELLQQINTLTENMSFPSKAYNLGYQSTGSGINRTLDTKYKDLTRTNSTKRSDMVMFISPKLKNAIDSKVGAIKFHNQYFDISKYKVITLDENVLKDGNDELIVIVDKEAFKGYFRINEMVSQFWASNLTTDLFHHYWLVFGSIPWANGVKIKISNNFVS